MPVYHLCAWCPRGQKRVLGSLEVYLQMVVSYHVCAGTEPQALWEVN